MRERKSVDWTTAPMTKQAQNAQKPENRKCVIQVPRESFAKYWPLSWSELEDAAARGEVEPWVIYGNDLAPVGAAWLREGKSWDGHLRGQSLLYSQGWTKYGNGHSGQFDEQENPAA